MPITVKNMTGSLTKDLGKLFGTDEVADNCWCMWFIISVKEFQSAGAVGNRNSFCELAAHSNVPLGLLAYDGDEVVGWCAVGPRSRYIRALKTPTYIGGGDNQNPDVWLVPCFFIRKDARGTGISLKLLEAAVRLAKENGATAIEGFPVSSAKRSSSGAVQVGSEKLFSACGFEVIRTPSKNRVVMRREF